MSASSCSNIQTVVLSNERAPIGTVRSADEVFAVLESKEDLNSLVTRTCSYPNTAPPDLAGVDFSKYVVVYFETKDPDCIIGSISARATSDSVVISYTCKSTSNTVGGAIAVCAFSWIKIGRTGKPIRVIRN